jgi:hypothetical protein
MRLRVHFRNVGTEPIAFSVGGTTGVGSMYNVEVTSMARDGKSCHLLNTTVGAVGGYIEPVVIHLLPGASDYVAIDLKKLVCATRRHSVALDVLLRQGGSVQASFTSTVEDNTWAKLPDGWTGTATSGTFYGKAPKQASR